MRIIYNKYSSKSKNKSNSNDMQSVLCKQTVHHSDITYKLANYVFYTVSEDDPEVELIVNTVSGEILAISTKEFDAAKNGTLEEVNPFLFDYMVLQWFLIPDYMNEQTMIDLIRNNRYSYIPLTDPYKAFRFIILTTTDCNARCYYCYEKGCKKMDMTEEIANDVADFIIKSIKNSDAYYNGDNANISWFGGEPTFNFNAIRIISEKLNDAGIKFVSSGITNGYLLDENRIKYLREVGHCSRLQITLDGVGEDYNKIKNYIYKDNNPFEIIDRNIKLCLKYDIEVSIRLNLTVENYDKICDVVRYFFEDLCPTLTEEERTKIGLYHHAMFADHCGPSTQEDLDALYEKKLELIKLIHSYNGSLDNLVPNQNQLKKIGGVMIAGCMIDTNSTMTINPDGSIGKCEHYLEESAIGSIYGHYLDLDTERQIGWRRLRDRNERCSTCHYYATCAVARCCPGGELCSPNFVKYLDYQNVIYMNGMYRDSLKNNDLFPYKWNLDSKYESTRSLDDLVKITIDDKYRYILNTIRVHNNDYMITIPVDATDTDIVIYRYAFDEHGVIEVYDLDSLEENLVLFNWATKIVDNGLLLKIINTNLRKKGGK